MGKVDVIKYLSDGAFVIVRGERIDVIIKGVI